MNIAVMGAGNGALAVAYEWASRGHRVTIFSPEPYTEQIDAIRERGGITTEGLYEGFAPIAVASSDADEALEGAEVILVVGPAYATEPMAVAAKPHLKPGVTVVVLPTSCAGSLAFKKAAGLEITDESVLVGETNTLPYACRAVGPATVHVYHAFSKGYYCAAVPRSGNEKLQGVLAQAWPEIETTSIFGTTLANGNPVIHPAVCIMNGRLMDTAADWKFYEEGVTPAVGRLMEAVDKERIAIGAALGVEVASEPEMGVLQGYMEENNYSTGYSKAPGFIGIAAPKTLDNRYLTEDCGFTQLFFRDLARRLGVPTPAMDAETKIAEIILERDFESEEGRSLNELGLGDYSPEQLAAL